MQQPKLKIFRILNQNCYQSTGTVGGLSLCHIIPHAAILFFPSPRGSLMLRTCWRGVQCAASDMKPMGNGPRSTVCGYAPPQHFQLAFCRRPSSSYDSLSRGLSVQSSICTVSSFFQQVLFMNPLKLVQRPQALSWVSLCSGLLDNKQTHLKADNSLLFCSQGGKRNGNVPCPDPCAILQPSKAPAYRAPVCLNLCQKTVLSIRFQLILMSKTLTPYLPRL